MQGIEALAQRNTNRGPRITEEDAAAFGRALSSVTEDELESLRELSSDLREAPVGDLQALIGVLDFLEKQQARYPEAVRFLIQRDIVEPGDLPNEYVPSFFSILRGIVMDALTKREQGFAKGGIVSLKKKAEEVRRAGTGRDTVLAHIMPEEAALLKRMGGAGTINEKTGLPEYGIFKSIGKFLKKAAPIILPVALNFVAPGLGTIASGAIGAGVGSLIAGAKPGDALKSALLGGVAGGLYSGFSGPGTFMQNIAASGLPSGILGGAERAFLNPSVTGAFSGFGGGASAPSTTPVSTAPTGISDVPYMDYGGKAAASGTGTGFFGGITDKVSGLVKQYPLPALGLAALAGGALGSSGAAQPVPSIGDRRTGMDLLRDQPGVYGFDVSQFRPRSTTGPNVVPTPSPAFPGGYPVAAKAGGHIAGPGTGTSDSIPAYLSDGEFVLTAKAVRGAGDGDRNAGAKRLYKLMNQLERRA